MGLKIEKVMVPLFVARCEECGWEGNPVPHEDDAVQHAKDHPDYCSCPERVTPKA